MSVYMYMYMLYIHVVCIYHGLMVAVCSPQEGGGGGDWEGGVSQGGAGGRGGQLQKEAQEMQD